MERLAGFVIFILLTNWDKGEKVNIKELIIQILLFIAVTSILKLIWSYVKNMFHFSIPQIPEVYQAWIGGILFMLFSCTLSFLGWQRLNRQKKS